MSDAFPAVVTVSLKDATPGSIIRIGRHDGCKVALATDQIVNNVRSFVWLNPGIQNKPYAIFAENWRNDPSVLQYISTARFELGSGDNDLDPIGRNVWDASGVIVSIGTELFIRAAPFDDFYDRCKLVNIRDGSVYSGELPSTLWTFLSWQLWIRSPDQTADFMLTEFP